MMKKNPRYMSPLKLKIPFPKRNCKCWVCYIKYFFTFRHSTNLLLYIAGTNESLKNLLYNPHLRNLLTEIDTAPNAWKAIRAAMQEPLFLEFADECLKIVEPQNEED